MRKVLLLYRNACTDKMCKGVLFKLGKVNFIQAACTLEPPLLVGGNDGTVVGSGAALPRGRYRIRKMYSNRFKMFCYRVVEPSVAQRAILIHMGNTRADTQGCILVGTSWKNASTLYESRKAFARLPTFDDGWLYILNPDDKLSTMTDDEAVKLALKADNQEFFEAKSHNVVDFDD